MTPDIDALIADWHALRDASRTMAEGPAPTWPWSEDMETFLDQQARRDRVQGVGMRFAARWHACSPIIADMVRRRPDAFAEYHVVPKKGDPPDPTSYGQAHAVMPRIAALKG